MGSSFLITLREGLEISLIVAIVLAYLRQTDRREYFRDVWRGVLSALLACAAVGTVVFIAVGELHGKVEQLVEGSLAISAAGVLTWMIFWMRKRARGLGQELRAEVDAAVTRSAGALAVLAFVVVAREGLETALFLLGAKAGGTTGVTIVIGGVVGLLAAGALGVLVYQGGHRVPVQRFFQVTGFLLVLFAAGLFAKGIHEFRELLEIEGALAAPMWTITSGVFVHGWFAEFLQGMFGWSADPERVRVIAYLLYVLPIGAAFLVGARTPKVRARSSDAHGSAEGRTDAEPVEAARA